MADADDYMIVNGELKRYYGVGGSVTVTTDTVTSIGRSAFENCAGLTHIILPDTVTSIGARAFCSCITITRVHLPAAMMELGEGVFRTVIL